MRWKALRVAEATPAARECREFSLGNGVMKQILMPILFLATMSGCAAIETVGQPLGELYNLLSGNTPGRAARRMEDPYFPDERREGINYLVARDFGKRDPYTERYEQIALTDKDYLVRATAVRALNRARDAEATGVFISALSDQSPMVRLEGAKALSNVPDPAALAPLIRLLENINEDRDVRIAAAQALKHYKNLQTARTLVNMLSERNFGVAWQSRQSLVDLTGKDLGYDEAEWLLFLTGPQRPFG
jgi:hypothetical protein